MKGSDWIALAAVASATLIGFVGPIVAGVQQRRAEHEKHVRDRRAGTYIDMLVSLERDLTFMARTYPIIGSSPDPPAQPSDDERWMLNAQVSTYGTERVKALLEQWNEKIVREFILEAARLRDMRSAERGTRRELMQEWGTMPSQQYEKLQEIRGQARQQLTEIQRVIAAELQISVPPAVREDPSERFNAWLERR